MTLNDAFADLADRTVPFPAAAIQTLLDQWDEAAPRCRALLQDYVLGCDQSEATAFALYPIVYLLGEKHDATSLAGLCALGADPERADLVLGDAGIDAFPRILINCFGGNPAPLQALVCAPHASDVLRGGALLSLAFLAHAKRWPQSDMHAYLVALHDELPPDTPEYVWFSWVMAVGLLGFAALAGRAAALFQRGALDAFMSIDDFRADLRHAAEQPAATDGFDNLGIGKLRGAIAEMQAASEFEEPSTPAPYVNPLREVGRNDPCPCGSGRKFKKCCLA